jgi:hypothetical protein
MKILLSSKIVFVKPPIDEFLIDYNNLLGRLFKDNFSLKYLASSTITKLEAHTHFYELVEKYIQIRKLLLKDSELIVELVGEDKILFSSLQKEFKNKIIGENRLHKQKLLFVARIVKSIISTFIIYVLSNLFAKPAKRKYDYIFRTYFYSKNVDKENIHEEYFGPVIEDVSKESKSLCIFKFVGGNKYIKNYLIGKDMLPCDSTILEFFLSPKSIFKATKNFLRSKIVIKGEVNFKGHDITELLNLSLKNDYLWLRGYTTYLEYEAVKKISKFSAKRIFWPYENQNWEKVYGLLKKEGVLKSELIGLQHSGLSFKLIHYFPSKYEKNLPVYPDYIFTVGEIFKRLLIEKGNYPCKIYEAAATRQQHIFDNKPSDINKNSIPFKKAIAYAYSYDLSKYSQITNELINHFKNTDIMVYLKFHPRFSSNEFVLNSMNISLPNNFKIVKEANVTNLFHLVDCILYDDNSVGFEGMLYGIKTFMFDCAEPIYDCNRLFYAENTKIQPDDLAILRDSILNGTFINDSRSHESIEYLEKYYTPYKIDKHLKMFIID